MRAVETGSSVGSSYVDALAYAVSSCVTEPSWRRGVRHGAGQPASASPAHAKMPRGASEQQSSLKVRKTFGLSFAGERDSKTSDDPVIFGLGCTVGKRTA